MNMYLRCLVIGLLLFEWQCAGNQLHPAKRDICALPGDLDGWQ